MRILILSRGNFLYSTQRLLQAVQAAGHYGEIIDYSMINTVVTDHGIKLYFEDELLTNDVDLVIGRIGPVYTPLGAALLDQFEQAGAYASPFSHALMLARNKWRAVNAMFKSGVPMPKSAMINDVEQLEEIAQTLGGFPLVIKLLESTHGAGVILAPNRQSAKSTLGAFNSLHKGALVQEYIRESGGADVRVIVVGGKIVAAMTRTPAKGEFRSNLHRGGKANATSLSKVEAETVINAASAVNLEIAGVDFLRSKRGPLVMEVNASPGLEGIEAASGVDVAGAIINYLIEKANQDD